MNKKYILALFLITTINPQYASENNSPLGDNSAGCAIIIGAGAATYFIMEAIAIYRQSKLDDSPPAHQKWARNILSKNDPKDAQEIPLKIEANLSDFSSGGFSLVFDTKYAQNLEEILTGKSVLSEFEQKLFITKAEHDLLIQEEQHENNNFQNVVVIPTLAGLATYLLFDKLNASSQNAAILGFGAAGVTRYYLDTIGTQRAHRSAFMSMSLDKIKIVTATYEAAADIQKDLTLKYRIDKIYTTKNEKKEAYNNELIMRTRKKLHSSSTNNKPTVGNNYFCSREQAMAELGQKCIDEIYFNERRK